MKRIPKQEYAAEFKALAVKRVKDGLTVGAGSLFTILVGWTNPLRY